jgi:hypothetical protein
VEPLGDRIEYDQPFFQNDLPGTTFVEKSVFMKKTEHHRSSAIHRLYPVLFRFGKPALDKFDTPRD